MILSDPGTLAAAAVCAGLATGVVLLVVGLRGVPVDPTRPPTRLARARAAAGSPALTGRIGGAVLAGSAALLLTRWVVAAVGVGALVVAWPHLFGGTRAEQAAIVRLEALVAWTESMRDTIAAHASLEQAIPATAPGAPGAIRPALVRLVGQIRARAPMDEALRGLAGELDDPSADLVIAALILNVRRRGDRLAEVLSGLAAAAREELELRRQISAGRAGLRRGVAIVVVLTLGFAAFLIVFGGAYVAPYDTPGGQVALAVVVGLFAAGFWWLRQLSLTQASQPFLSRPGAGAALSDPAEIRLVASLTGLSATAARALADEPAVRAAGRDGRVAR